ncbi:MAG TPA: Mur ligase family protein [Longimicrobiales bacterium]
MRGERTRRLGELAGALSGLVAGAGAADVRVTGVTADTRTLRPGQVFVAVRGATTDGHDLLPDAIRGGASAVVVEREPAAGVAVPVLRVADGRTALAELAAAWYGRPADRLSLVGITGSLGKTSTLSMLEAVLAAAGLRAGTIGSLGIRFGGAVEPTRLTTPAPLELHRSLARFTDARADLAVMEVTSHALVQDRIHGLTYDLGIFTNLVPFEHLEYHGSFRAYAAAKSRFFDHLGKGAPFIHPAGDRAVKGLARGRDVRPVSCGPGGRVSVRVERLVLDRGGTRVVLSIRSPFARLDGGDVEPVEIPIELQVLGRPNIANAALAAAAGLCLGAPPSAVREGLAGFRAPRRRMQVVHRGRFTVLDDTVGHPDSIGAVFEVAERIAHRRLHIVYAIRGRRGEKINRRDAETVAIWARRIGLSSLIVTASADAADEANRVAPAERAAFLDGLRPYGVPFEFMGDLAAAVDRVVDAAGPADLVLLLGAQGMDRGAEMLCRKVA